MGSLLRLTWGCNTVGTNYYNKYIFSIIFEWIYKENNEIIDYFRHLSDIYSRIADFVKLFILYFSSIAIPFTIIYSQLRSTNLES